MLFCQLYLSITIIIRNSIVFSIKILHAQIFYFGQNDDDKKSNYEYLLFNFESLLGDSTEFPKTVKRVD